MAKGNAQLKFFEFLQRKQKQVKYFNKQDVISATGWKPDTFKTYFSKGQITQFVTLISADKLRSY